MKSAIALCFLAVLCATDATILDILLRKIQKTKSSVENIISQLERLRADTEQETNSAVMQNRMKQMEKYDSYVESVLADILKETENAKANGKDAQPCHDAAYKKIRRAGYTANDKARKCQEKSRIGIDRNLEYIVDNLISIGRDLMTELDNIFPDCYAEVTGIWDAIKLRTCIYNKLNMSKINVKNMKKDATSARTTAKRTSKIVIEQGTQCLNKAYSAAHTTIDAAKECAIKCINRLKQNE